MAPQPSGVGAKAHHIMHIIIIVPSIPMLVMSIPIGQSTKFLQPSHMSVLVTPGIVAIPMFYSLINIPHFTQSSHMSVLVAPGIVAIFIKRLLLGRGCATLSFLRVGSAAQLCPRRNHAQTP